MLLLPHLETLSYTYHAMKWLPRQGGMHTYDVITNGEGGCEGRPQIMHYFDKWVQIPNKLHYIVCMFILAVQREVLRLVRIEESTINIFNQ